MGSRQLFLVEQLPAGGRFALVSSPYQLATPDSVPADRQVDGTVGATGCLASDFGDKAIIPAMAQPKTILLIQSSTCELALIRRLPNNQFRFI